MEIELQIKKIEHEGVNVRLPERATPGSAGIDLCAAIAGKMAIEPGESVMIPTGVAIGLPGPDCAAFVFARSGLAVRHGIALSNGVGVIDSDYRGEIVVGLRNFSDAAYLVEPGERIAQLVVLPVAAVRLAVVRDLEKTQRAGGGFGSTGRS